MSARTAAREARQIFATVMRSTLARVAAGDLSRERALISLMRRHAAMRDDFGRRHARVDGTTAWTAWNRLGPASLVAVLHQAETDDACWSALITRARHDAAKGDHHV